MSLENWSWLADLAKEWYGDKVAREIKRDLEEWTISKYDDACRKWPWELLQNALDCARSANQKELKIVFDYDGKNFTFKHDGAYGIFTGKEFLALLTKGTTKEYDGGPEEGRFGEGFVVTHVLSPVVRVQGFLEKNGEPTSFRPFEVLIDRRGSENDIAKNIQECMEPSPADLREKMATFIYDCKAQKNAQQVIMVGLNWLQQIAPFVLSIMNVRHGVRTTIVIRENAKEIMLRTLEHGYLRDSVCEHVQVQTTHSNSAFSIINVLLFKTKSPDIYLGLSLGDDAKQIKALDSNETGEQRKIPKIFTTFPLMGTLDIKLPVILFGKLGPSGFHIGKERLDLDYKDGITQTNVKAALAEIKTIWQWCKNKSIGDCHRLLLISPGNKDRKGYDFWGEALKDILIDLSQLDLVDCEDGLPRKLEEVVFPWADIEDDAYLKQLWELLWICGAPIPARNLLLDWTTIRQNWLDLGVICGNGKNLESIVKDIAAHPSIQDIIKDMKFFPRLLTREQVMDFFKRLFLAIIYFSDKTHQIPDLVFEEPIYCNQKDLLKKSVLLHLDQDIPEELKIAAKNLGHDLREELLARELVDDATLKFFEDRAQMDAWNETLAAKKIFEYLRGYEDQIKELKGERRGIEAYQDGLVKFTQWLCQDENAENVLTEGRDFSDLPFVWNDGSIVSPSRRQLERFYLPQDLLDDGFKNYINLFSPKIILNDAYSMNGSNVSALKQVLLNKGKAVSQPLYEKIRDLNQEETKILQVEGEKDQHWVKSVKLVAVAGFSILLSEIAGGERNKVQPLLKFLLEYLIKHDSSWKEKIMNVECSSHKSCFLNLLPSEWLLQLKNTSWVPIQEGKPERPNSENLEPFIWEAHQLIKDTEARNFLPHLGFDALELNIFALATSRDRMAPIREKTAAIIGHAANIQELTDFEEIIKERHITREGVRGNQFKGKIVQEAVKYAFRNLGFQVPENIVSNLEGYDFEAVLKGEADLTDIGKIHVGKYFIEVKATTQAEVKMTYPQASNAVGEKIDRYLLCVADLRGQDSLLREIQEKQATIGENDEALGNVAKEMAPEILPFLTIVHIGHYIGDQINKLTDAFGSYEQGVWVERGNELRFIVSERIWKDRGTALAVWVEEISEEFRNRTG